VCRALVNVGTGLVTFEGSTQLMCAFARDLLFAINGPVISPARVEAKKNLCRGNAKLAPRQPSIDEAKYRSILVEVEARPVEGFGSVGRICKKHGVNYSNFSSWRARRRREAEKAKKVAAA